MATLCRSFVCIESLRLTMVRAMRFYTQVHPHSPPLAFSCDFCRREPPRRTFHRVENQAPQAQVRRPRHRGQNRRCVPLWQAGVEIRANMRPASHPGRLNMSARWFKTLFPTTTLYASLELQEINKLISTT